MEIEHYKLNKDAFKMLIVEFKIYFYDWRKGLKKKDGFVVVYLKSIKTLLYITFMYSYDDGNQCAHQCKSIEIKHKVHKGLAL